MNGKIRLCQLSGINSAKTIVSLTNAEIMSLWVINEDWQRACHNYLGEINNKCPKSKHKELIERSNCILPRTVKRTPIPEAPTFYTDANKMRWQITSQIK